VAVRHLFGQPVNFFPVHGLKEIFLLVSVGRCKFQLTEISVGLLLQATMEGVAADFRPLSDRMFKFVVASKNVGFQLLPPKAKIFRFENYCRMREEFIQIMEHGWNLPSNQTDLATKKGFEVQQLEESSKGMA
jgi:hypothetical protein